MGYKNLKFPQLGNRTRYGPDIFSRLISPRKGTCSRSFSLKIQKKILRHHWVKSLGSCHRKLLFSWILLSFHNLTFTNCLKIFLLKGYTIGPSKTCESTRSQLVIKIQDVGTKAAQVTIGSLFCRTRKKQLHDY